jgi:hypothetical protein
MSSSKKQPVISPPATVAQPTPRFELARRHRDELRELGEDSMNRSLQELISGAVVMERKNVVNLGVARVVTRFWSFSYRAKEALPATTDDVVVEGAEWVTVSASTTLRHLINEYGDRLLGYDAKKDELTIEFLSWDVVDATVKSVRVLVRKHTIELSR